MGPIRAIRSRLAVAAFLVSLGLSAAETAWIPAVVLAVKGRTLKVEARLEPSLPADVEKRLSSGLPTTTLWQVRLYVLRGLWFDGLKDERRYEVTATYRPDTGDYTVERRMDGRLLETRVARGRSEAAAALQAIPSLPCFTLGRHLSGKRLVVKVRCGYGADVALGFVPVSAETDWVPSDVFEWSGGDDR